MANFALTGIARSGSSLTAGLISGQENTYCMNEVFLDAFTTPIILNMVREFLINDEPIPDKYNNHTLRLNTKSVGDTMVRFRKVHRKFDKDSHVGVKVTIPFLSRIQWLVDHIITLAVIRSPVYTIGSWHGRNLDFHTVLPANMTPRFAHVPMVAKTLYGRQAELWNYFASSLLKLRDAKMLTAMRYEDLVKNPKKALEKLLVPLGIKDPNIPVEVKNLNQERRYNNIDFDLVREAVHKYSPMAKEWGYEM